MIELRELRKFLIHALDSKTPINIKLATSIIIRHNKELFSTLQNAIIASGITRPTMLKYLKNDEEVTQLMDNVMPSIDPRRGGIAVAEQFFKQENQENDKDRTI